MFKEKLYAYNGQRDIDRLTASEDDVCKNSLFS